MNVNVKKGRSGRERPVWQWVVAVVVSLGGWWLGLSWVERYFDVKSDCEIVSTSGFSVDAVRIERGSNPVLIVTRTREPDGWLWNERVLVHAEMQWLTGIHGEAQLFESRPIPLSMVTGIPTGVRIVGRGSVVDTVWSEAEIMAAVSGGGVLVRPCPDRDGLIGRTCLGAVLIVFGMFAAPVYLVALIRAVRRAARVRVWKCVGCGYDLGGLAFGTRCPECGEVEAWGRGGGN